jgi:predicted nucleotide-binding protein
MINSIIIELDEETTGKQVIQVPQIDRNFSYQANNLSSKSKNKVFVVHGRDDSTKEIIARFLRDVGLEPIILHEQPNKGRTIIEKFEDHSSDVAYAVVLLTPDDVGGLTSESNKLSPRARQNVVFEMGHFFGRLGRKNVCALLYPGVERPSDIDGIVYIPLDRKDEWKGLLIKELKAAKLNIIEKPANISY